MNAFLTVVVFLVLIAAAAFVIHRLNAEHAERIAVHRYSRPLASRLLPGGPRPGDPRRRADTAQPPGGPHPSESPAVGERRDHRDGGRGRFPPRRRRDRTTHHG
ncbi:hypothetical protein [Streptomyces sp. NPDC048521]|uniref:hypothetical protein n=1 Tax=Streptomyces sp. NPDC048521 TaxID=3365566 RepID=UPI0037198E66